MAKLYIAINTDLEKKRKNDFAKDFVKLMNHAVFEKTMENVRKHRDVKLVTAERRSNYLVSEPNYHTTKFFTGKKKIAIEMKKTETLINKPVSLGLSTVELRKILMYEFWYDYAKPKYGGKAKLFHCIYKVAVYIKTDDIYKDIPEDVETRFDTSNYKLDRPLNKERNKKVTGLMKDELGRKIMIKFVGLRVKTYSYLINDASKDKKQKVQRRVL